MTSQQTELNGKEVIDENGVRRRTVGSEDLIFTGFRGTNGNDVIQGTSGNDTVDARDGDDIIYANDGDDFRVFGDNGNDTIYGGNGDDFLMGNEGDDALFGEAGKDTLFGRNGVDTLTGGADADSFAVGDSDTLFDNPTTAPNGIQVVNKPDIITDYELNQDVLLFDERTPLGIASNSTSINFQKGKSNELAGNSSVLVLTDPFANAGAAAKAIADNNALTADAGAFVYYNTTLGVARVVASQDLSDGGPISVLANLNNVTDPASLANFSAGNFSIFFSPE